VDKRGYAVETDARLETIRKLLNKAEASGVTPEESLAFTKKAEELIAKYGIDEVLAYAQAPEQKKLTATSIIIMCDNPYADDKGILLNKIVTGKHPL